MEAAHISFSVARLKNALTFVEMIQGAEHMTPATMSFVSWLGPLALGGLVKNAIASPPPCLGSVFVNITKELRAHALATDHAVTVEVYWYDASPP